MSDIVVFRPSDLISVTNEMMESSLKNILIKGEVCEFNINQGKWVFFGLKDDAGCIKCFLPLQYLRIPLEDGMKIVVRGTPKLIKSGSFSVTVTAVRPVGEGSIQKAYRLLKKKLTNEGLFDASKKRPIPQDLNKIGVISSTEAAGYADFIKILNARWGGMKVTVAHTQVQGIDAPDQIVRALDYFNERGEVEMIAIIRGGGSAEDLAVFNDEKLVRAIAASKIPVITGVGHEVDESLCDLAADVRASTPSNAAEMLSKDRRAEQEKNAEKVWSMERAMVRTISSEQRSNLEKVDKIKNGLLMKYINPTMENTKRKVQEVGRALMTNYVRPMLESTKNSLERMTRKLRDESRFLEDSLKQKMRMLEVSNPEKVLQQGYAILSGKVSPGDVVKITTFKQEIKAEVKEIHERKKENIK